MKIERNELAEQIALALKDYFEADVKVIDGQIELTFDDQQHFTLSLK